MHAHPVCLNSLVVEHGREDLQFSWCSLLTLFIADQWVRICRFTQKIFYFFIRLDPYAVIIPGCCRNPFSCHYIPQIKAKSPVGNPIGLDFALVFWFYRCPPSCLAARINLSVKGFDGLLITTRATLSHLGVRVFTLSEPVREAPYLRKDEQRPFSTFQTVSPCLMK